MKKRFLLMMASAFTLAAHAQEAQNHSVMFQRNNNNLDGTVGQAPIPSKRAIDLGGRHGINSAEKTTLGGGRWYSYAAWMQNFEGLPNVDYTFLPLWNDTTAWMGYSDGSHSQNKWTSVGMGFNPMWGKYNDVTADAGLLEVTGSDSYTIDSVRLYGYYMQTDANLASTTATDELKITLVYGDGTSTSNLPGYQFGSSATRYGHYNDSNTAFLAILHDSLNNTATGPVSSGIATSIITLHYNDTFSFVKEFGLTTPLMVPPGNAAAASVSFRNPAAPYPMTDTVQHFDGSLSRNEFYSYSFYKTDGATPPNASWATYDTTSFQDGSFKREGSGDGGWGGMYVPTWAWSTGGGATASALQFPGIDFHVSCSTCYLVAIKNTNKNVLSGVKAYPSPADEMLTILFNMTQSSDVTVSITNMVGQQVAAQNLVGVKEGRATFSTKSLPAGIYMYTLQAANGNQSTGRIVVSH